MLSAATQLFRMSEYNIAGLINEIFILEYSDWFGQKNVFLHSDISIENKCF
jgi:hypothetical protein